MPADIFSFSMICFDSVGITCILSLSSTSDRELPSSTFSFIFGLDVGFEVSLSDSG